MYPKTINNVATFNDNIIQIKGNNIAEVKNKVYSFVSRSRNKEYWTILADLI
ncbi:MAG: hypothetical protein N2B06_01010 [Clostridium sp.]